MTAYNTGFKYEAEEVGCDVVNTTPVDAVETLDTAVVADVDAAVNVAVDAVDAVDAVEAAVVADVDVDVGEDEAAVVADVDEDEAADEPAVLDVAELKVVPDVETCCALSKYVAP